MTGETNGAPSLGEIQRSQVRMEKMLEKLSVTLEEKYEELRKEVSTERHRVNNLLLERGLTKTFMERAGSYFDRVDALEKKEIAEDAVRDFKKALVAGKWLGGLLGLAQLFILYEQIWGG